MTKTPQPDDSPDEPPTVDDGFHKPSEDTRRRNLITALIIGGFVLMWVLYGLRKPLFGLGG